MRIDRPSINGQIRVPGDKSISHRALIFSLLTAGTSKITGLSPAQDCVSSIDCLSQFGLTIESEVNGGAISSPNSTSTQNTIVLTSPGLFGLKSPKSPLFAGNSGTTMRLLAGAAAGQAFITCFDGDESLSKRPMLRVLEPLMQMGAQVNWAGSMGYAPFAITGGNLKGIDYHIPTASAQVQTALLLAGLQSSGQTVISVTGSVRDHTVRLFRYIGVPHEASADGTSIAVTQLIKPLPPFQVDVPADISSCAFFMVAAVLLPGSAVHLMDVGINPGRRLVIDVLKSMGADIVLKNMREVAGEPVADIVAKWSGRLCGATIGGEEIASGIDEVPILALAGALCQGQFSVSGASELKVKESDRLTAIVGNLKGAGAKIIQLEDGFEIEGQETLAGGSHWQSFSDHRLAMTGFIANLISKKPIVVDDVDCVAISYPSFQNDLNRLLSG